MLLLNSAKRKQICCVSCWRRLNLESDGNVVGGGSLASNNYVKTAANMDEVRTT